MNPTATCSIQQVSAAASAIPGEPIKVYDQIFEDSEYYGKFHTYNVYYYGAFGHELAHKLDEFWFEGTYQLSTRLRHYVGGSEAGGIYFSGAETPPIYDSGQPSSFLEDFAESFSEYVYLQPERGIVRGERRWVFIETLLRTGMPPLDDYMLPYKAPTEIPISGNVVVCYVEW